MSEARRSRAIGMLILATPCWALSFPVMKALALEQHRLLPNAGSWFFTSLGVMIRFGVAGLLLLPLLLRGREKISGRELEQGIALALFGGAKNGDGKLAAGLGVQHAVARQRIGRGEAIDTMVAANVADYIAERGLYRE